MRSDSSHHGEFPLNCQQIYSATWKFSNYLSQWDLSSSYNKGVTFSGKKYAKNFSFINPGLASQAFGYNGINRLQLIEDRYKLQESLAPLGHDFAIDTRLSIGGEIFELVDDINDLQTLSDGTATDAKFSQNLLS